MEYMEVDELFRRVLEQNASDLHLSPDMPPMLRINGTLKPIEGGTLNPEKTKNIIYSIMSQEQIKEFENTLELDFAMHFGDIVGFRVNAFHEMNGIGAVFRIIPNIIPTLDQLALPSVFKQLLDLPNGIILITGPTGSGKSTTLAAMVDYINTNKSCHIITIEDPIEFRHKSKKSLI